MANSENVTFGKPKVGGAIFSAPIKTPLPTDATTALDTGYKELGYASEDGIANTNTSETDVIKAWGGDDVLVTQAGKEDTFTMTLIEATNVDVLKSVYGNDNVSGTLDTGITIKANSQPLDSHVIVIDMILKGGVLKRIVIPNATVSEVGEIIYNDTEAVGYETTFKCVPDGEGNTHYEYIVKSKPDTEAGA